MQKAETVEKVVAIIVGKIMIVGSLEPPAAKRAIAPNGTNCKLDVFRARNIHMA